MRRSSPLSLATLLIVACGSPQGLDEDQFPDQYAGQISASGGTGALPPVGNTGGTSSTGGSGGSGNLGGSSGAPAANGGSGGSGGGGVGGSGSAQATGGTGGSVPGTGGTGGATPPPPAGNCPDDITVLFNRPSAQGGCADGGCHTAGGFPPDLVSPNVEMRLLNVASSCQGRPFVGANDSFLLEKIEDAQPGCGGLQMPLAATQNLSASDKQCIADWVAEVGGGG